ncbi:kelch repeat and BTB domain-containing protein 12 [Parasteatoda tepidariorum]|uniref:kelch repeat and BTB domain-containing protein 12 n=1 Tax=Parasteatoda tepidariorum TaxID=114398 RepID=UPI001C7207DF|nr:uncharacterized protein LOC107450175 [Parasteatoda tepidariorum]
MANNLFQELQGVSGTKYVLGNPAGYKLFFNERDSDVCIKVEYEDEKWQFPAHKLVLCTMSEVFRTMMEVDMLEKNTRTIIIRDTSPHAIKQFMKYLYMGVVEFTDWNDATTLLKVAHKYSVQTLIGLCENYLTSNIKFSNVCILYELARTYSLDLLEKESQDFILEAGFIVSATHGFFDLKPQSMEYFLSNPFFNIENEGCLLTSLKEWAVSECTRKCISLTEFNVLSTMEPFLKLIQWHLIPECNRTFIPTSMVEKVKMPCSLYRRSFGIPKLLQNHISYVKCSVELGIFHHEDYFAKRSTPCLRFSTDNHMFFVGFRIIGLFHKFPESSTAPNYLILSRDDGKVFIQLNLMSLPWSRGASVGCQVWKEMTAYLPYPVRVDPYNTYALSLRSTRPVREDRCVKWPITRLDTEPIQTNMEKISLTSHGCSYGVTQLFILPAPPFRNVCNREVNDW